MSADQTRAWRRALQEAITNPAQAWQALGWTPPEAARLPEVARRFSVRIPHYYLGLIDPADPNDPIALQCLPSVQEVLESPGDIADAVGDEARSPTPGIVHKYPNRVILLATNTCSMYCRFCFRKPVPDGVSLAGLRDGLSGALAYIAARQEISEVILSGGDPLVMDDGPLDELLGRLRSIPHVATLRIHSRVPVTLPMRISPQLARVLASHRPLRVVTHFNHPRELTAEARRAVDALMDVGVPVLNQAVLLRGVNNSAQTLVALFDGLYSWGVSPYYLHHCDRTPGTAAFRTGIAEGKALIEQIRQQLSGPAMPRYVLDVPGGYGKVPIDSDHVVAAGDGVWQVTTRAGEIIEYRDPQPPAPASGSR